MKLYRFTGENNHKAMLKAQDMLGVDALVYSTRKTSDGVEILAGLPINDEDLNQQKTAELEMQPSSLDHRLIEHLNSQLRVMDKNIQQLTDHVSSLYQVVISHTKKKKIWNWKLLKNLKFSREGIYGTRDIEQ